MISLAKILKKEKAALSLNSVNLLREVLKSYLRQFRLAECTC